MARLLHLAPPDRHLRGGINHTRDIGSERRYQDSRKSCGGKFFGAQQLIYATEERGQVFYRLAESFSYDCASDAARPGEAV